MVTPLAAMKAYGQAQKTLDAGLTESAGASGAAGFGDLLRSAMSEAVQTSRRAETQMAAHAAGKAELVDVVTAVSAAEASLETVMAIRDQVIQAYQEVMRMPI